MSTKRDLAIASVRSQLDDFDANAYNLDVTAETVVDNLIRDGVIALSYFGDSDTSLLVDAFQMLFGTTAPIRTDRFAASRLVKRYGVPFLVGVVEQLAARKQEKFMPTVNNLTQLEAKWPQVMRFVQSKGENETDL